MLNTKLNRHFKLILCTCLLSCNQFIIGCTFVFSSILLAKLKEPTTTIKINTEDASWIASVPILVCPIGLLVIGVLTDKIGRRKALQVANIPIIVSWLVLAFANSLKTIIIGRTILGISLGLGTCTYLYLAEICPTKYRPLYFSVVTIFVGVGMMTECILSMFFHWQTVSLILFAVSTASGVSLFVVPETPMWLRTQGRIAEAEAAEKWLGMDPPAVGCATVTTVAVDDDDRCNTDRRQSASQEPEAYWRLFVKPNVWKPTLITVSFFICQQGCAFYVLLFYSVDVLRDCRVQWDGITVTVFLCVSRVIGSLMYSMLHHVKRKTLTVVSSSGMAISLVVIVAYMKMYKNVDDPPYNMLLIVSFIAYVFFALLAMLPLPWTLCGELFPMAVKGTMNGIVQTVGYELMFIIIKLYPALVSQYGIEDVWSVFAVFCVISALFGAFIMPETKGKSLNDILKLFEPRKKTMKNIIP